jgi:hypothetical protein
LLRFGESLELNDRRFAVSDRADQR